MSYYQTTLTQSTNHKGDPRNRTLTPGKSTGVVTTAHITHASPAGNYAHTAERHWYADDDLSREAVNSGCVDIARQFLQSSDKITVRRRPRGGAHILLTRE